MKNLVRLVAALALAASLAACGHSERTPQQEFGARCGIKPDLLQVTDDYDYGTTYKRMMVSSDPKQPGTGSLTYENGVIESFDCPVPGLSVVP